MVCPPAHTQNLRAVTDWTFQDGSDKQPIHPGLWQLLTLPLAGPFWIVNNLFWKTPPWMLELEMVPQHFLVTKAEQQNSDILSRYVVYLQTLSPYHLSTMCDSQWKGSQRKNKTKKPKGSGNNLDGCNPQNYCPFLKPLFTNVLVAVSQTLLMKVVLSNSGAVYSYSSTAPQHSSSQLVQVWWPLRTINTKLSKIKGDRTTGCE